MKYWGIKLTIEVSSVVNNLPTMQETWEEDPLEVGMVTHSSILGGKIPRTEEPGGLQSTGSQRVGHDWSHWVVAANLTKEMKDWHTYNYKSLMKEIKEDTNKWKDMPCS